MKWIKGLLVAIAILLAGAIVFALVGLHLLRGAPEWYRPRMATTEEMQAAAERAEHKFIHTLNTMAEAHAREDRARHEHDSASASSPGEPVEISFTDDEINAFFLKWADSHGLEERFGDSLSDPMVVLRENRLILAGMVEEMATVVSLHFAPGLDEEGQLRLRLLQVRGGRLPLPPAVWHRSVQKLTQSLQNRLPELQRQAEIAPDGASNEAAINAAMTKLLLRVLNDEPAEPVVFLPVHNKGRGVPVRLTRVGVADDELQLTVQRMTPPERRALLQRIREPLPPLAAANWDGE
jgi:hypothetical protein